MIVYEAVPHVKYIILHHYLFNTGNKIRDGFAAE